MKNTDTFQANPEFMTREIAGEVVLVPVGKTAVDFNGLATLNKTGAFLWKLLEEKRTVSELCKTLAAKYGLEEEQVLDDVTEFITMAQKKQAVLPVIHC